MAFVLNTKLKIVFIIFAVVIVLYVIQFVVSYVNSEKKREAFEEESKPSQKKDIKKSTEEEKAKNNDDKLKFQDIRLEVLEAFEDVISDLNKNKENTQSTSDKHVLFNTLLEKKDDLVKAYQEGNLKDLISNHITSSKEQTKEDTKKEQTQKSENFVDPPPTPAESQLSKKMDKVLDQTVALTKIEEIVTLLSQARDELKNVAKEAFKQKEQFVQLEQEQKQQKKTEKFAQLLEGFENTKNYAYYI